MHEPLKIVPFELKALSDEGEFEGYASVYGNVDQGNDIVEPGAFDKSLSARGRKVRLMSNHKVPIGVATVESTPYGLKAVGKINTKKQSGAEALSDLRFYRDEGAAMGMSIGYETVVADVDKKGIRHLKEVILWEVTITEFPMNEDAKVIKVKSIDGVIEALKIARKEKKDDFETELLEIQLWSSMYQMMNALDCSLSSIRRDSSITDRAVASSDSIDQFKAAYLKVLPDYLALLDEETMGYMSRGGFEGKSGRVLSQSNRDLIGRCIKDLQDLLDSADADKTRQLVATETKTAEPPNGAPATAEVSTPAIASMLTEFDAFLK